MELKPENKKKSSGDLRIDPLPCVSAVKVPETPHRVTLAERSWPFLGSFALHVVLFGIFFFPVLQPSSVTLSQTPTVLWLTPFIVPGDGDHLAGLFSQPAALAQQTKAAEPVSVDSPENEIASDLPATPLVPTPTNSDETVDKAANADSIIIQPPPKVLTKADRRLPDSTPALRKARPSSNPPREGQLVLPAEQADVNRVDKEHSYRERVDRQDEKDRLSRELATQKRALAEISRHEQLVREQAQQALREQSERELIPVEKIRQEQETQEKIQQTRRIQEEKEQLTAEKTRQVQRAREREQQALREQAERKRVAADEKARKEREAQEQLQQARRIQEEKERLAVEKARQMLKVREQEQQALREQAKRKQVAAAEQARQERETQERLLRERKLQEEMMRRKRAEQPLEKPIRVLLPVAVEQQDSPSKLSEKHTKKPSEKPSVQKPQKGLIFPIIKGDLKLVVTGTALPKMTIMFKEFALSRRNRAFSRAEARRETPIIPLVGSIQEFSNEVVIEKTTPGIYTITSAPVGEKADASYSLKVFEGSARSIIRTLGRRSITGKMVLFKILMPEGILWDDEKAFTGSMEDSESITKFNAETGLVWKEYNR